MLAALFFAAVAAGCGREATDGLNGITRDPLASTKNLALPDESPESGGKELALKGDEGGLMLVYFGYTSCPDVCPTSMADLRLALAQLNSGQREHIAVSMVTVDPERDTGKVLNSYLGYFFKPGEFHSLRTEDMAKLARVEEPFSASHQLGKPDRNGEYEVSHSTEIYAVDDHGNILVEWPFQTDPDLIAEDIKKLLEDGSKPADA